MSQTQQQHQREVQETYPRDNWWHDEDEEQQQTTGHDEVSGTDAAEYVAFQLLLDFVEPICGRTLGESGEEIKLSEPKLHLPKQHDTGSRLIENRQHRHRRRYNEETGYINWGETTSTEVPQVGWETFEQAVHNYLNDREVTVTRIEDYLQRAKRLFYDQQLDSHEALEKFVRHVRDQEAVSMSD